MKKLQSANSDLEEEIEEENGDNEKRNGEDLVSVVTTGQVANRNSEGVYRESCSTQRSAECNSDQKNDQEKKKILRSNMESPSKGKAAENTPTPNNAIQYHPEPENAEAFRAFIMAENNFNISVRVNFTAIELAYR